MRRFAELGIQPEASDRVDRAVTSNCRNALVISDSRTFSAHSTFATSAPIRDDVYRSRLRNI